MTRVWLRAPGRTARRARTVVVPAVLLALLVAAPPVPAAVRGVVIESVPPGSASGEGLLASGDRVLGWRQQGSCGSGEGAVADPFEWRRLEVERAPCGPLVLEVDRGGRTVALTLLPGTRGPGLWRVSVRPAMSRAVARAYLDGVALAEAGRSGEAVAAWDRLRGRRAVRREPLLEAWLLVRGARELLEAGEGEAACARFGEAAAVADRAGAQIARAAIRDEWGRALYRSGEYERALEVHREALELRDPASRESLWLAAAIHDVGTMTLVTGDLEGAAGLLEDAAEMRGRLAPDSLAEAESINNLGLALVYAGSFEAAQERLQRALAIRELRSPGSLDVAAAYNNLGLVAKERGDFETAERCYLRDLELSQRLEPDSGGVAITLMNLGAVAWERGDLALAEERFGESLRIVERLEPDGINVAANLNNLALVAEQRGDLVAAERNLRRALAIWRERTPGSQDVGAALLNLGLLAWRRKDLDRAEELLRGALDQLDRTSPDNQTSAMALLTLGDVELDRGDLAGAEGYYRASLELRETIMPGSPEIAANLINLAAVAQRRGDLDAAESLLHRALELREVVSPDSLWVAASLHGLGDVARQRGELATAESLLGRALAIRSRLAPGSTEEAETLHQLAMVARQDGRLAEAASHLERAVAALEQQSGRLGGSEEARAGFRAHFSRLYRELLEVQLELGRPDAAFETLERSRAQLFLATLAERDLVFAADLPEGLERRRKRVAWDYDRALETLRELDPSTEREAVEATLGRLAELRREREEVREEVRAAAPRLASLQYPETLTAASAAAALEPGTLVLAYSLGESASTLFTLSREDGLGVHRLEAGAAEIGAAVSAARAAIVAGGGDRFAADVHVDPGRRLYDLLVRPVLPAVERSERLVVLPDGALHALPFAALVCSREGEGLRYLVELRPIAVTLSVTVLEELARSRSRAPGNRDEWRVVAFADPEYRTAGGSDPERGDLVRSLAGGADALEPLPASRQEAVVLEELWAGRASTFVGADATEDRAVAEGGSAAVLHLACHGLLDEHFPLDSALALAEPGGAEGQAGNGLLQAWEIFERMRIESEVVTLSACQTALGRELGGEGLVGLTRAFQYAGARSVVASLWSVSDLSTAWLMEGFYRSLREGGATAAALRAAQLEMLRRPDTPDQWRHPFFWAAFQVIGDWR